MDTVLLEQGVITEAGMLQSLADVAQLRLVNLADFEPNENASAHLPAKISKRLNVVPLSLDKTSLHLACAYPVPQKELREVAFLLGKHLELWVALEVRVREWQAALYREPMPQRFYKVLKRIDLARAQAMDPKLVEPEAEAFAVDVDLSSGEHPIGGDPFAAVGGGSPAQHDLHHTVVLDARAYSAYAKPELGIAEVELTTVLDPSGYANFARELSKDTGSHPTLPKVKDRVPTEPEVPVVFPGGVLPPRSSGPKASGPNQPTQRELRAVERDWVTPASAPRPHSPKPSRPQVTAVPPSPLESAPTQQVPSRPSGPTVQAPDPLKQTLQQYPGEPLGGEAPPTDPALAVMTKPPAWMDRFGPRAPLAAEAPPTDPVQRARPLEHDAPPTDPTAASPVRPAPTPPPPPHSAADAAAALAEIPLPPVTPTKPLPIATPHGKALTVEAVADDAPLIDAALASAPRPPVYPPLEASSQPLPPMAPVLPPPGAQPPSAAPGTSPQEWTLAQAREALKRATHDREALLAVALDYARRTFDLAMAFAVVRGAAYGWAARSSDGELDPRSFAIPLDAASVFRTVALTRGSYVGPVPPDALTQHYLALFGRSPRAVFLWPIEVQGRLVAMLYGDAGAKPMSQRKLNDFILFCRDLPGAFHELLVFRKQLSGVRTAFAEMGEVPPPAETAPMAPETQDETLVDGLLQLLLGPDAKERGDALAELMRMPHVAAKALVRHFPGPSGWSRLPVVELPEADELGPVAGALSRLGPHGAEALAPLLDADDSDVRYFALLTAGSLQHEPLLAGVMRGLFDVEPDVSSAARAAAGALKGVKGFEEHLHMLRQELASRDSLRRSLAARALGMLHDRDGIEGLINLTGSDDQLAAQAAAEALREICKVNLGTRPTAWLAWFAEARARRRADWLVEALAAEDFDLRLSAIEELSRSLGDNLGFFADGALHERQSAVERWRSAVAARPGLTL